MPVFVEISTKAIYVFDHDGYYTEGDLHYCRWSIPGKAIEEMRQGDYYRRYYKELNFKEYVLHVSQ